MGGLLSALYQKLFSKKLELCILGLENVGKTTFVNTLMDKPKKTLPTIGLNVKDVKKGSINNHVILEFYRCPNENMGYRWAIPV
jgi:ADP-ribosylation factor-like protein 8